MATGFPDDASISDTPRWRPVLRRRATMFLLAIAALVLVNIVLFELMGARVDSSATALSRHVDVYRFARRVQVAVDAIGRGEGEAALAFNGRIADFDHDFLRLVGVDLGTGLSEEPDPELKILLEGLISDWKRFQISYQILRGTEPGGLNQEFKSAFVNVVEDLKASVIAVNFIVQRDRVVQFDRLHRAIVLLGGADLAVLFGLFWWLRRRVIEPIERITEAARRLAGDDFSARVEITTDDEIGELAAVLDTAAGRVQDLLAMLGREADALRQAESKFRTLAEDSLVGVYLMQDGMIVYANPMFAKIFGFAAPWMVQQQRMSALVAPDDAAIFSARFDEVLAGRASSIRGELRARRQDGHERWIEIAATRTMFEEKPAIVGTLVDLTNQKESDRELRHLKRAVEQSTATVLITDRSGRIVYVNPRFEVLTGYTAAEAIDQTPRLFQSGMTPPALYVELWGRLLAGHEWQGEILNRKKSGETFWEYMVVSPVRDDSGEITHFIAVKEDISARKKAEAELRATNRTLQVLSACNQSLVHAEGVQPLIDSICRHLTRIGGFPVASVGFPDDAEANAVRLVACAGPASDYAFLWSDADRGRGNSGECIRRREMIVTRDIASDPSYLHLREGAARFGLASAIALPLLHGGEVFGAIRIYSHEVDSFSEREVELLSELAEDLAYGLHAFRTRDRLDEQATELAIRQRALESSRNGVMITRVDQACDNPIIYTNAAFESITGYARADVQGRNPRFLVGEHWAQPEIERLRDALRRGGEVEVTVRNVRRDGTTFWNELSLSPVRDDAGRTTHYISILSDVTDRVRYQEELQHHVTHDTLTGLANRALLADRIEQAVVHAGRLARKAAVLMIDLDRFKLVNDSLGHAAGDELLRRVAERLAGVVRRGDTVARFGSDEFVVVLSGLGDVEQIGSAVADFEEVFVAPFSVVGQDVFVSASIGISVGPDDGNSAEMLLRNAEVAMYAVKKSGGSAQRRYESGFDVVSRDRLGMETDLRRGIERGELVLFYQPKLRFTDGTIVGAEALIRWQHPERGLVPPMQFIPLAEETGLIGPIGDWVIHEAIRQLAHWRAIGLPPLKVAVNLSARQFRSPDLAERVLAAMRGAGVETRCLELELTETMLMQRGETTVGALRDLHAAGLSLAIDDFGTGYSSLSYLQRFPIDTLKIDRSFVKELENSHDSRVLVETIIMMGRNLGKTIVAEGVETTSQARFLRDLGCDEAQGFLYSRPVEESAFVELLRRGRIDPIAEPRPAALRQPPAPESCDAG